MTVNFKRGADQGGRVGGQTVAKRDLKPYEDLCITQNVYSRVCVCKNVRLRSAFRW